jgi:ABC-type branched-subunit amino acid transport system ATPase component
MGILDVRCVTKRFGAVTAVDGVSFQVRRSGGLSRFAE